MEPAHKRMGAKLLKTMVARDGVEWNYVPVDGLILYPKLPSAELPGRGKQLQTCKTGSTGSPSP